ncbi:CPBP family glutamic-type intramembrane protease (plasmid) [Clostridium perfringens]
MFLKKSIIIDWTITSISFGLFHLPTYNWNLIQCILLGVSTIIDFYAYIKTKNIFIVFWVHYLYDLIPLVLCSLLYNLLT